VHGQVRPVLEHRDFEFLDEQALAADLGQGAIQDAVALRDHRHQLDLESRVGVAQACGDVLGLPEGQPAAPGRDAKRFLHRTILPRARRALPGSLA
jgi:hypothetical protein